MFCPSCGSEERQLSQYCRACGVDLRVVRAGLEKLDSVTASAVSARDHISRAIADKIREAESASDLKKVAEDVLPQIDRFLESPEEKRLRRIRTGVIFAAIGLGGSIISLLLTMQDHEFIPLLLPGFVCFFIGIGIVLNGLFFTLPRRSLEYADSGAMELDAQIKAAAILNPPPATTDLNAREAVPSRPSVTEHTTHQLKQDI